MPQQEQEQEMIVVHDDQTKILKVSGHHATLNRVCSCHLVIVKTIFENF